MADLRFCHGSKWPLSDENDHAPTVLCGADEDDGSLSAFTCGHCAAPISKDQLNIASSGRPAAHWGDARTCGQGVDRPALGVPDYLKGIADDGSFSWYSLAQKLSRRYGNALLERR